MNEVYLYFLKSAISLSLLYLVYWFFLRKDTFFAINRFYLLLSLVFSFVVPLLQFNFSVPTENMTYVIMLESITISAKNINQTVLDHLSLFQILLIVYLTGAGIFFVRFLIQLIQIFILIKKYGISRYEGLNVVFLDAHYSPFSFFHIIFINERKGKKEIEEIVTHERIHAKQLHSIDLILLELATIFQWFNPFIWLYRHSIKSIHEFLADEGVLLSGVKKTKYQQILLSIITGIQVNELSNNFNKSILKRRFMMMTKTKSGKAMLLKYAMLIPVALMLVVGFACSSDAEQELAPVQETKDATLTTIQEPGSTSPTQTEAVEENKEEAFVVVEKQPEFVGGQKAMFAFLGENIEYPESAQNDGIAGRVFVQFVVEKDGSITDVHILRSVREDLDKEAVRVVESMPNWIPGEMRGKAVRVVFNLPIKYTLD
jgi:bla regulator protein blaR1